MAHTEKKLAKMDELSTSYAFFTKYLHTKGNIFLLIHQLIIMWIA